MRSTQTQQVGRYIEASHLDLAGETLLAGMTREQVIVQLVSRIRREEGYLAYRKGCNRRTRYDEQVQAEGEVALLRSEEHTSELQSLRHLVCRLLLEKKKTGIKPEFHTI